MLVGIEPGRYRVAKGAQEGVAGAAVDNVRADVFGLGFVEDDEIVAALVGDSLRGGCLRLLVPVLAVDDRSEALLRVALDVLPDVQDRAAGGVDKRAASPIEARELVDRHAERGQDHHVVSTQRLGRLARIAQEPNVLRPELVVDMKASRGKADPKVVTALLKKAIGQP